MADAPTALPRLYMELAEWWPLLSAPADYEEEADYYRDCLIGAGNQPARTLLELGSGGGNNAFHLKRHFEMTLTDLASGMLAQSRKINPECEHIEGDMRTLRLARPFDRVFVHDAVTYLTSLEELRQAADTAFIHLRPGGGALFVPDCVRETFEPSTDHGGHDGPDRSLRYLEWCWDPDPHDCTCVADYVYVLRDAAGSIRIEHDRHVEGLFSRAEWVATLRAAGFDTRIAEFHHSELDAPIELFVCTRPEER